MSLPILTHRNEPSRDDLVRYFHRAMLHWTRHTSEESPLDFGVALHSADLDRVFYANRMLDAAVPEGVTAAEVVAEANAYFEEKGTRCWNWIVNPSSPAETTRPLVEHLLASGYTRVVSEILHLPHMPASVAEVAGLTIIPARASYRHARALAEEASQRWNEPQLIDAAMLHLDDPHVDALLAMRDGVAVAIVHVLAVGEIGLIEDLFVSEPFRGQGIGRTMLSRALEICARSLFRHVFIDVAPDNAPARALYGQVGFTAVGELVEYLRPA